MNKDDKEAIQKLGSAFEEIREHSRPGESARPEDKLKEPKAPEYAPGELIVKLKEGKTLGDI